MELYEFDINKTIQNYGDKLINKIEDSGNVWDVMISDPPIDKEDDFWNGHEVSDDIKNQVKQKIINIFVNADPTNKKAYVLWIINIYLNAGINRIEDLSRLKVALTKYVDLKFKNKLKPEHKDINRVKSLNELEDLIDDYAVNAVQPQSERQKEKEFEEQLYKKGWAILYYNDAEIKIVIPNTKEASCFFGRNTRWCTASTESYNYFGEYNEDGPLYIILIKKENKRYQFHIQSNQFMNEKDQALTINDLMTLRNKYPQLVSIFNEEFSTLWENDDIPLEPLIFMKLDTFDKQEKAILYHDFAILLISPPYNDDILKEFIKDNINHYDNNGDLPNLGFEYPKDLLRELLRVSQDIEINMDSIHWKKIKQNLENLINQIKFKLKK